MSDLSGEYAFPPIAGELTEKWPKDENGEFVAPVFLTHCSSVDMEDIMTLGMLAAYDIPALKTYPNDGSFGKVILGMSGTGVSIFVPQTMFEEAKAILEAEPDDGVYDKI